MIRFILNHTRDRWQVVRYGVVGLTGVGLQAGLLYLFVETAGLWYLHGVVPAFVITLVVVFLLQKYWTFRNRDLAKLQYQSSRYTAVALGSLAANLVLMYLFVDLLHVWYLLAQIIVALGIGLVSFLTNKIVTFASSTDQPSL